MKVFHMHFVHVHVLGIFDLNFSVKFLKQQRDFWSLSIVFRVFREQNGELSVLFQSVHKGP